MTDVHAKPLKIVRWPRWVVLFMMLVYMSGFIAALVYGAVTHGNGELFTKFRNVSPVALLAPLLCTSFLMSGYSMVRNLLIVRKLRKLSMGQARSRIL